VGAFYPVYGDCVMNGVNICLEPVKTRFEVVMDLARQIAKKGGRGQARFNSFKRDLERCDITADEYESAITELCRLFRV